jgi:diguanylate cyclase (GGDEF)-like protein/PAS domain S-box-containing protein
VAPVRLASSQPPDGVERRARERLTLELAARTLALLERSAGRERRRPTRVRGPEFLDFFEHGPIALRWMGADGTILRANAAELDLLGYRSEDYVGRNIAEFMVDQSLVADLLRRLAQGEAVRNVEAQMRHRDGSIRHVLSSANALFRRRTFIHARCSTSDVTELKLAEMQLRRGMMHDALTGLPNRALFLEFVGQALHRAARERDYRFAVLLVDCDHFKQVNDSFGHFEGDRYLQGVARCLEVVLRPGDIVSRFGGDEFALCLEVADEAAATQVAERIQAELARQPIRLDDGEVVATASIGIVVSGLAYDRAEDLLRDADIAMYRAKAHGRARYELYDATAGNRAQVRLAVEADLRRALQRNELRLVFQPIVELATGRLTGFEALLRWDHPQRGRLEPQEFIPVAEESGLIISVGMWVLREACRCGRAWQRLTRDGPFSVNVNVSPLQLSEAGLVVPLARALGESELPPSSLRLEITESVLVEGIDEVAAQLERLRALGVEVYLDDFGTGYSSLTYLRRLPVTALKIDRSFVQRVGLRRGDYEIVRTVLALAHNLGLGVIAEGVETPAQRDRLLELGCALGQGILFAAPLEAAAAEAVVRAGRLMPNDGLMQFKH